MSETSTTRTKPLYEILCKCGTTFVTARRNVSYCSNLCRRTILRSEAKERRAERLASAGQHKQSDWYMKAELSGFVCYWCGISLIGSDGIFTGEKDHLTPVSRGGSDQIPNIVAACHCCNHEKGDRTAEEYTVFLQAKSEARKMISEVSTGSAAAQKAAAAPPPESFVRQLSEKTRMPMPSLPYYGNRPQQINYQKRREELARQVAIITSGRELCA